MKTTGTLPNSYTGKEIQINWFHASHWPGISEQWYNTLAAPCGAKPINVIRDRLHWGGTGMGATEREPKLCEFRGGKSLWKRNLNWSTWFQFTNKYIILQELVLCSPQRFQRLYFQIKININVKHTHSPYILLLTQLFSNSLILCKFPPFPIR